MRSDKFVPLVIFSPAIWVEALLLRGAGAFFKAPYNAPDRPMSLARDKFPKV
jgi:hypothetical protein